ncbi:uncharacterized protein L969DRAFT_49691 [Mixia osmundae IAM 14324]|uniref:Uncharacterized protein n=1 Tax=Mixia osmundae (strain CBS 9802 / IAM 14324 / JCM 22182 / KY 12970) TaxID=764103 RepID=G7E6N1_MIXOS|nr:uncharacterized protein L969DRAFT_49691 [Mixia osmundae IAM 14324]KEI39130.1 hypothetical protein L969DRAFT_49691 [Mixia osmundae IAM 14324]GAA98491.1 hypothetical protein E5Q_05177 [Mixia osmundae IAM 14324]
MDSTIWSTAQDVIAECCHASREMAFITAVEPDASSYSSQTFEVACNAGPVKKVSPFCARVFGLDSTIGQCELGREMHSWDRK